MSIASSLLTNIVDDESVTFSTTPKKNFFFNNKRNGKSNLRRELFA